MVVTAVFNLMEGVDIVETEAKIALYEKENAESIARNAAQNVCILVLVCCSSQ